MHAPGWTAVARLIGRHQLAAAAATAADFSVMTAAVQVARAPVAASALLGAVCGGVLNFHLARGWIFGGSARPAERKTRWRGLASQALRYVTVSAASALLNAAGILVLHHGAGPHWLVSRAAVAVAVGLAWNLPMHRHFVFQEPL